MVLFNENSLFVDRILAPTTYIFFASALPVIAFGEQLSRDTGFFFIFFSYLVFVLTYMCIQKMFSNVTHFVYRRINLPDTSFFSD